MEVFKLTVNQLANMFIFLIIGFFMRKKKIGGDGVSKTLSALLKATAHGTVKNEKDALFAVAKREKNA